MSRDCIGCEKRYPGCHSKCELYIAWREAYDKRKDIINDNKQRELKVVIYKKGMNNETGET